MSMHRCQWSFAVAVALVMAMGLTACSSSPNPTLYTIAPVQGTQQSAAPKVILLQQIGLERYLERSQIVRSSEDYKLDVMANDWWGEPLGAMLSRVLVAELSQRLPQSIVDQRSRCRVRAGRMRPSTLNVQRLDEDAAGKLVLRAQAGVLFKGRPEPALRNFEFADASRRQPASPARSPPSASAVGRSRRRPGRPCSRPFRRDERLFAACSPL